MCQWQLHQTAMMSKASDGWGRVEYLDEFRFKVRAFVEERANLVESFITLSFRLYICFYSLDALCMSGRSFLFLNALVVQ